MSVIGKLFAHLRSGTLGDVLRRRTGRMPEHIHVRWYGAEDVPQAARAMSRWARHHLVGDLQQKVLILGDGDEFHLQILRQLRRDKIAFDSAALREIQGWGADRSKGIRAVFAAYPDARRLTAAARAIAIHPQLAEVPFEYVSGLNPERAAFERLDEYRDTHFVSPVLLDEPTPYQIYEESLRFFEQKCGLRDYLDLYQWIRNAVVNRVPGDIAEFGSYKGHSGWLIAHTLKALGSDKRLFMFDMFEAFPQENVGVDHFWSRTHRVDFAEVKSKFRDLPQVTLVKGDFTQTLAGSGVGMLALAYVDCDSYRATRYLFEALWKSHLSRGGVLVCEDYGHPALLGNRAAVHESLDQHEGGVRYFSQFSGLYFCLRP